MATRIAVTSVIMGRFTVVCGTERGSIRVIWATEGKNNESYVGVGYSKKEDKFPTKGGGGSGEVGMVSHFLPLFSYESSP